MERNQECLHPNSPILSREEKEMEKRTKKQELSGVINGWLELLTLEIIRKNPMPPCSKAASDDVIVHQILEESIVWKKKGLFSKKKK